MTATLEGGEWSAARPDRILPPGKTRYPFYRRLVEPQGRSGRAENLVPTGIRSRIVEPVVSRYTDLATRPTTFMMQLINENVTYSYDKLGNVDGANHSWGVSVVPDMPVCVYIQSTHTLLSLVSGGVTCLNRQLLLRPLCFCINPCTALVNCEKAYYL